MKWNNKFTGGLFFILLLGSACTDVQEEMEINRPDKQGKNVRLTITTQPLQVSGTITRSEGEGMELALGDSGEAATRAIEEDQVANICVFQFEGTKEASTAVLKEKTYLDYWVDDIGVNLASSTSSFLYVCANVGDITKDLTVGRSTFQDLMNASYTILNGHTAFDRLLPMSGCSDEFDTGTLADNIVVPLIRMVAKVTFVYDLSALSAGAAFNVTGVKLRNVPKHIKYYPDSSSDANVDTYIGVPVAGQTATYTWFVPENMAGTPQNTVSYWTERFIKNAPLYATYIELTGNYTTNGGDTYETTYVVYLGDGIDMDNYDVVRNHHYKVTSKIKGANLADHRVTIDTNLSADGLANCYLAGKDNHRYRFNGSIRGNGNSEDYATAMYGLRMIPDEGVDITGITQAFVVWETTNGLIRNVQWDAASGCVKFETGEAKGNAVIAVANRTDDILWSWHIWRTDNVDLATLNERHTLTIETNTLRPWYEEMEGVGIGKGSKRSLVIMDRNIGSAFDGALDIDDCNGEYCLHYQFGRKDPFPGGTEYGNAYRVGGDVTLYGHRPRAEASYTIYDKISSPQTGAMAAILAAIKNPEVFYGYSAEYANWIWGADAGTNDLKISNCLWGDDNRLVSEDYSTVDPDPWDGKKTIYDPSPAGWRVAPSDTWTGILKENVTSFGQHIRPANVYMVGDWASVYDRPRLGGSVYFNNHMDVTTFLPASGRREPGGYLAYVGYGIYCWFSCPSKEGDTRGDMADIGPTTNVVYSSTRATGLCVRCVRE